MGMRTQQSREPPVVPVLMAVSASVDVPAHAVQVAGKTALQHIDKSHGRAVAMFSQDCRSDLSLRNALHRGPVAGAAIPAPCGARGCNFSNLGGNRGDRTGSFGLS